MRTFKYSASVTVALVSGALIAAACGGSTDDAVDPGSDAGAEGGVDTSLPDTSPATDTAPAADATSTDASDAAVAETSVCGPGTTLCGAACVDTKLDPAHCGGCTKACATGQVCSNAACGLTCTGGTTKCGDRCVDTKTDVANCGGCAGDGGAGAVCVSGQVCADGACATSCPSGQVVCDGKCIDPSSDLAHCGATGGCGADAGSAGQSCGAGLVCAGGSCAATCAAPLVACDGKCVDPRNDPAYCGATAGCGADAGSAGAACSGGLVCSGGTCQASCVAGQVLCAGKCVNPATDNAHCGATAGCGVEDAGTPGEQCAAGKVCSSGSCQTTCAAPLVACDGACVDPRSDIQYCGATVGCGVEDAGTRGATCTNATHGTAVCLAQQCKQVCETGYAGDTCSGCANGYQDDDGNGTCNPACAANTCQNGGTCSTASGSIVCACRGGFSGASCATSCAADTGGPGCAFSLVYALALPADAEWNTLSSVPYSTDRSAVVGSTFTRIGYRLVLDTSELWVEMDAFTTDPTKLGVPVDWSFDQPVANVTVLSFSSNQASISTPTAGTIEFWNACYDSTGGNNASYDYDDTPNNTLDCYGSMQVHVGTNTLFGYNRWTQPGNDDLGIGARGTGHPDWTFANNAGTYTTRTLEVYVK